MILSLSLQITHGPFQCTLGHSGDPGFALKLIIKISSSALDAGAARRLAHGVAQLVADRHRVVLVHGGTKALHHLWPDLSHSRTGNGEVPVLEEEGHRVALMMLAGKLNKELVAMLSSAGVAAFGLWGSDANMIRIRKKAKLCPERCISAEVAAVDPMWLDIISKNGAVPVLAALAIDNQCHTHLLPGDQTATACAVAWDADALIFVTEAEAPKKPDGTPMRWIEAENVDELTRSSSVSGAMASKLKSCRDALKHGVRRARILPATAAGHLASFYFSRIELGTEVILTSRNIDRKAGDRFEQAASQIAARHHS